MSPITNDKLRHRLRVVEAACILTVTNILLRIVPFGRLIKLAGGSAAGTFEPRRHAADNPLAASVGKAIKGAAARLPWRSACLVQALAGRVMLMRRGVPSTLILGVAKPADDIEAHAWLLAGGDTVCGGGQAPNFRPIATFQDRNA